MGVQTSINMNERHEEIALAWLYKEIVAALHTCRGALEAFAEQPGQPELLQDAVEPIHQVLGSLEMTELSGPVLLCQVLEQAIQQLAQGQLTPEPQVLEVVMRGMLQLPMYLERLQAGEPDMPLVLRDLVNELRQLLGQGPLSAQGCFLPHLNLGRVDNRNTQIDWPVLQKQLTTLNQHIQVGLLELRDKGKAATGIGRLYKVSQQLCELSQGMAQHQLWEVLAAVLEGVIQKSLSINRAVLDTLNQCHKLLAHTAAQGDKLLFREPPDALLRGLLYLLAHAAPPGPSQQGLIAKYQLQTLMPSSETLSQAQERLCGPDQQAFAAVFDILQDEIRGIKERVDVYLRQGQTDSHELGQLLEHLNRVAATLHTLGLTAPYHLLQEQTIQLQQHLQSGEGDYDLMELATALLYLETSLHELEEIYNVYAASPALSPHDVEQAKLCAIKEAVVSLQHVKSGLGQLALQPVAETQDEVISLLQQVTQVMVMIEQTRPLPLLTGVLYTLQQAGEKALSHAQIELVAEVLVGIEFYLDSLHDTRQGLPSILQVAAERLASISPDAAPVSPMSSSPAPIADAVASAETEEVDPDLLEIFAEEAQEVLATLQDYFPRWQQSAATDQHLLQELRRGFHTLKGSGRMVYAEEIAELAWTIERLMNQVLDGHLLWLPEMDDLVEQAITLLPELIRCFIERKPASVGLAPLQQQAQALTELPQTTALQAEKKNSTEPDPGLSQLLNIFIREAREHIDHLQAFLVQCGQEDNPDTCVLSDELMRTLHTLKGSAQMACLDDISAIIAPIERYFKALRICQGQVLPPALDVLHALVSFLPPALDQLEAQQRYRREDAPARFQLIDDKLALLPSVEDCTHDKDVDLSVELGALFMSEGLDIVDEARLLLTRWQQQPSDTNLLFSLQREFYTLSKGAQSAQASSVAELARALEALAGAAIADAIDLRKVQLPHLLAESLDSIEDMLDRMAAEQDAGDATPLVTRIHSVIDNAAAQPAPLVRNDPKPLEIRPITDITPTPDPQVQTAPTPASNPSDKANLTLDADAAELLDIFLEEAQEILEQVDVALQTWQANPSAADQAMNQLLRDYHTLKGGARLANLPALGDLTHVLETLLGRLKEGHIDTLPGHFDLLLSCQDGLRSMVSQALAYQQPSPQPALISTIEHVLEGQLLSSNMLETVKDSATASVASAAATPESPVDELPTAAPRSNRDTLKIKASDLEHLINIAGEAAISRTRLEQQFSQLRFGLDDLVAIIGRVGQKVRAIELEADSMLETGREHSEHSPDMVFDSLEMDKYTRLQETARSLGESSNDLVAIRDSFNDIVQSVEGVLLQQGRMQSELQQQLLRTRMVPFTHIVPRLQRIVRQVSQELGKSVVLDVLQAEAELDRTILESMVPPLEHMLRNAIDHGIEPPELRKKRSKPQQGKISLSVARQGNEIEIRIQDDGHGINIDAVKRKALAQSLLLDDQEYTDDEILQCILQPGFSTAETVTQISGRGVGMDVVYDQIQQLGGRLDISTQSGQGSCFSMRLPFTVAVSSALLFQLGEETYAVSLTSIEGIMRCSAEQLNLTYASDRALNYANKDYQLHYLGQVLSGTATTACHEHSAPVLLLRGDKPIALQVDAMLGSRDIVMKSVGPQLGSIHQIAGATTLGDGRVVIILDVPAIVQHILQGDSLQPEPESELSDLTTHTDLSKLTILVVDDSITVRKVTQRLLERNGYRVVTAKDGVDALAQLNQQRPHLILLDIEMPRMDGFELASHIRHDNRLQGTPIVMITSRTGDKHRQRAQELGVNHFMGKPFQENELLRQVEQLMDG